MTSVALQVKLGIALTASDDGTVNLFDTQHGAFVRSFRHPTNCALHNVCVSGEGEVLMFSSDDRTAHVFALNGVEPLASVAFHDGKVRAICATQSSSPGYFVVAEDSSASVHRSHDLSLCARLRDAGGAIACASLHERQEGCGRLDVLLGLECGVVVPWIVELDWASTIC